jgi:hypothetical protein
MHCAQSRHTVVAPSCLQRIPYSPQRAMFALIPINQARILPMLCASPGGLSQFHLDPQDGSVMSLHTDTCFPASRNCSSICVCHDSLPIFHVILELPDIVIPIILKKAVPMHIVICPVANIQQAPLPFPCLLPWCHCPRYVDPSGTTTPPIP